MLILVLKTASVVLMVGSSNRMLCLQATTIFLQGNAANESRICMVRRIVRRIVRCIVGRFWRPGFSLGGILNVEPQVEAGTELG